MTTPSLDRRIVFSAVLVLASACGSEAPSEPAKAAKAEPTKSEPTKSEPAKATKTEPTKAAKAEPAKPPGLLRAVATREGTMTLVRQRDAALVVLDGEPLTLVDGVPTRHAVGSAGLWSDDHLGGDGTLAVATTSLEGLGTWTTIEHANGRTGSLYEVYQRKDDRWERLPLPKGLLLGRYAAYAEHDGSLLALQAWSPDPAQAVPDFDEADPKAAAYQDALERALARAGQSWVHLGGTKPGTLPEIPEGAVLEGGTGTTADGSLLALARERTGPGEDEETVLLAWRQGQPKAERLAVPDLAAVVVARLDVDGEHALVFGADGESESYLAIGRGAEWQRVPVSLVGHLDGTARTVSGAARLPDGELWLSLADEAMRLPDPKPVWRKPVDGAWEAVPLPVVERSGSAPAFVPDQAPGLLRAAGAVWVVVGGNTDRETEWYTLPSTTVLYTTRPGTTAPSVLPSSAQLEAERKDYAARSGKPQIEPPP